MKLYASQCKFCYTLGKEVMALKIGRRVKLYYQGIETSKRQIIKFGARLADDQWHRLGISVKGNSITAIIDCKKQQNREIARYVMSHVG